MIFTGACLAYALVMGVLAHRALSGRTDPRRTSSLMTRISAVTLPLLMWLVTIRSFVMAGWVGGAIIAPFAVLGTMTGWMTYRLDRVLRR